MALPYINTIQAQLQAPTGSGSPVLGAANDPAIEQRAREQLGAALKSQHHPQGPFTTAVRRRFLLADDFDWVAQAKRAFSQMGTQQPPSISSASGNVATQQQQRGNSVFEEIDELEEPPAGSRSLTEAGKALSNSVPIKEPRVGDRYATAEEGLKVISAFLQTVGIKTQTCSSYAKQRIESFTIRDEWYSSTIREEERCPFKAVLEKGEDGYWYLKNWVNAHNNHPMARMRKVLSLRPELKSGLSSSSSTSAAFERGVNPVDPIVFFNTIQQLPIPPGTPVRPNGPSNSNSNATANRPGSPRPVQTFPPRPGPIAGRLGTPSSRNLSPAPSTSSSIRAASIGPAPAVASGGATPQSSPAASIRSMSPGLANLKRKREEVKAAASKRESRYASWNASNAEVQERRDLLAKAEEGSQKLKEETKKKEEENARLNAIAEKKLEDQIRDEEVAARTYEEAERTNREELERITEEFKRIGDSNAKMIEMGKMLDEENKELKEF